MARLPHCPACHARPVCLLTAHHHPASCRLPARPAQPHLQMRRKKPSRCALRIISPRSSRIARMNWNSQMDASVQSGAHHSSRWCRSSRRSSRHRVFLGCWHGALAGWRLAPPGWLPAHRPPVAYWRWPGCPRAGRQVPAASTGRGLPWRATALLRPRMLGLGLAGPLPRSPGPAAGRHARCCRHSRRSRVRRHRCAVRGAEALLLRLRR